MTRHGHLPFGAALRNLLIDAGVVTRIGNPDWGALALRMNGVNYESLRKAVTAERQPSAKLMEEAALCLAVDPTVFVEYRLQAARASLDPNEVGWDAAVRALTNWETRVASD
jgi:hypothetical protein